MRNRPLYRGIRAGLEGYADFVDAHPAIPFGATLGLTVGLLASGHLVYGLAAVVVCFVSAAVIVLPAGEDPFADWEYLVERPSAEIVSLDDYRLIAEEVHDTQGSTTSR